MKIFALFIVAFVSVFSLISFSHAALLDRNLSFGDVSEDVRILQSLLNNDPRTEVAPSGAGSLGEETIYFGMLTRNAVIRFQELYAGDVLVPAGLARGSGYVGPRTRAELNVLYEEGEVNASLEDGVSDVFSRNLSLGTRGEDVRHLQKILNRDSRTRIALSGAGSPGYETDYFGELTRSAVVKFQNLYAEEVLYPLGLLRGTGFIGSSTRVVLNSIETGGESTNMKVERNEEVVAEEESRELEEELEEGVAETNTEVLPITSIFSLGETDELAIFFPSSYSGNAGDSVTLSGSGFTPAGNTVHIGSQTVSNLQTLDSSLLTLTLPEDISFGRYTLFVTNENGQSNGITFIIPDPNISPPVIERISPESGAGGERVTIFGSGFTEAGNTIYTGYSVIEDVASSDGKTLTFTVQSSLQSENTEDFSQYEQFTGDITEVRGGREFEPLWMYVDNERGFSNSAVFYRKLEVPTGAQ